MKIDHFAAREDSSDMTGKRKNVMVWKNSASQPLYIIDKNKQKKIGELNNGDLVYVITEPDASGLVDFLVIKFADSENHYLVFTANKSSFSPHEVKTETLTNVDGKSELPSEEKLKKDYTIPIVAGLGGAFIGYQLSKRVQGNVFIFAIGGAVLFSGLGYLATKIKMKKPDANTDTKMVDTGGSVVEIPDLK